MFKIFIGTTLNPKQIIVSGNKTVREIYSENNIPLSGTVTLNGDVLEDDALDTPIRHLNVSENAYLTITKKYASA